MRINESYAVFGLGRYGVAVAKELSDSGADVIAVDIDEELVSEASAVLPICRCADITDPDVIKQLGISNVDTVIIAMANSLEASVMAITLCKEAGVKTVIAKCANEMHQKILLRVGADKAVFPDKESGIRLAKNLLSSDFIDVIELSSNVSMIELNVKREWEGKSLIELNLRRKYSINVVAVRKKGEVKIDIDPATPLTADMKLIVIASGEKLRKLL